MTEEEEEENPPHPEKDVRNNSNNETTMTTTTTTTSKISAISDLAAPNGRHICIVTTASVPWRTGTSINPLARALYCCRLPNMTVTLYIPWLSPKDQRILFGTNTIFDSPSNQEVWIRQYCTDRIHCDDDSLSKLKIKFYNSLYHQGFGSIFPSEDICSMIPNDEADVAILEEPEHLNWFRSVLPPDDDDDDENNSTEHIESNKEEEDDEKKKHKNGQQQIVGWKQKFNYVIGILHTNYSAYLDQYSRGVSVITSSALTALSSLVVKSYCHRIIRLSDTLPVLYQPIEITCNVHGVRSEFFITQHDNNNNNNNNNKETGTSEYYSPIYFIGKLVWAKGFDKCLDIQDLFRAKTGGDFFPMDIYGSGPDEESIQRSFLGRKGLIKSDIEEKENDTMNRTINNNDNEGRLQQKNDEIASLIFSESLSLRESLTTTGSSASRNTSIRKIATDNTLTQDASSRLDDLPDLWTVLGDAGGKTLDAGGQITKASTTLGGKLVDIGFHATFMEQEEEDDDDGDATTSNTTETSNKSKYHFNPIGTKYELRRAPIPARFLGVKDHAAIRDIPEHKIFLNMSETEVLCTTTAEALAMGKFVIIPVHRKYAVPRYLFSVCRYYQSVLCPER